MTEEAKTLEEWLDGWNSNDRSVAEITAEHLLKVAEEKATKRNTPDAYCDELVVKLSDLKAYVEGK